MTGGGRHDLWTAVGALLAATGLVAAALAAHGLEPVTAARVGSAAQVQMWHALALLGLARGPAPPRPVPALMLAGVLLFGGTLYLRAAGLPVPGFLAPLGGLTLIAAWLWLAGSALGSFLTRSR